MIADMLSRVATRVSATTPTAPKQAQASTKIYLVFAQVRACFADRKVIRKRPEPEFKSPLRHQLQAPDVQVYPSIRPDPPLRGFNGVYHWLRVSLASLMGPRSCS